MGNRCVKLCFKGRHRRFTVNGASPHFDSIKQTANEEDEMGFEEEAAPLPRGRRQAVAAESYDPGAAEEDTEIVFYPKTDEQLTCLREAANGIVFFKNVDADQQKVLFGAMFEKRVESDDVIIRQGDEGDNFYVIEKGTYDIVVKKNGTEKTVATLVDKGFFGELALLYNCPRNASIIARSEGVLWGLDQKTFRHIVVKETARKRQTFEELLKSVTILESLTPYELMNLTDALDVETFQPQQRIIAEGDEAAKMYFVMAGQVAVRVREGIDEKEVARMGRGKYFGELALVMQQPRVASVYATEETTKCATLNIHAFERLLGPCVEIMKRNVNTYEAERSRLGLQGLNIN